MHAPGQTGGIGHDPTTDVQRVSTRVAVVQRPGPADGGATA